MRFVGKILIHMRRKKIRYLIGLVFRFVSKMQFMNVQCPSSDQCPKLRSSSILGFMSEWKMSQEMDRSFGVDSVEMQVLYRTIAVKKGKDKAKLCIYGFVYTLTYGHECRVVTKRARLQIQSTEIRFSGEWLGLA